MAGFRTLTRSSPASHNEAKPVHESVLDKVRHSQARAGYWLGSHQILSLLVSSILISTLLTPALLLYISPFSSPASSILRRLRGQLPWELDGLQQQGLIWSEDDVCWDAVAGHLAQGSDASTGAIVAEQVLIGPAGSEGGEAVSKEVLHKAWKVERELKRRLLGGEVKGLRCVASGTGGCSTSSPTQWWPTELDLLGDTDVHRTLSRPHSPSAPVIDLPHTLASTLVGPVRDRHGNLRGADFLAITFYLQLDPTAPLATNTNRATDTVTGGFHTSLDSRTFMRQEWRRAVRDVVGGKGWQAPQAQLGKLSTTDGQGQRVIVKVSLLHGY